MRPKEIINKMLAEGYESEAIERILVENYYMSEKDAKIAVDIYRHLLP